MQYWAKRLQQQQELLQNVTEEEIRKQTARYYKKALDSIELDISRLYDKLQKEAVDGKIRPNDLYKYNRYFELRNKINRELRNIGESEISLNDRKFLLYYKNVQKMINEIVPGFSSNGFIMQQDDVIKNVIDAVWCADGKHWSNRIWNNKESLQQRIEKGLIDCVSRGLPKDEVVKQLMEDFQVGFNQSDRIVRTELTHVQNQACYNRYKEAGVEKFEFLAEIDSRTSEICQEHDNKIYNMSQGAVGVNIPPLHPYCRSTIIPVIE